jgi:hypothetical protein
MRYTRLAAAILLAAYLPACTGYQVMADPSTGLQASPKPVKEARVTLRTGERFELMSPRVDGDSLRGVPAGGPARSVALADVATVEVRKGSTGKTLALVLGVTAVVGLVALVIAAATYEAPTCTLDGVDASLL